MTDPAPAGFFEGVFDRTLTNLRSAWRDIAESARGLPWEREALRTNWKQLTTRLGSTSIRWVPLVTPRRSTLSTRTAGDERQLRRVPDA